MFSVEFTLGRRGKGNSAALAPQIERPSCDPGSNTIGGQIDMKQRSGRGCWARLVAALGTLPLEALRLD
jgi:hypothetical protein